MKDQSAELSVQPTIEPQDLTDGTVNGASVDQKEFGSATFLIDVGLWIDGSHVFSVEVANDDGTGSPGSFAAAPAADLVGTNPTVDGLTVDNQAYKLGYHGDKRWARVSVVTTGSTTGLVDVVAYVVLGNPAEAPVA